MAERQKQRYVLSALNGMNIEAIGERNMKTVADLFSGYKLNIRFDRSKK